MNYQMMQLDEMNPSPYNPRKTLKPGEQKYEALKESISRFDLVEPIIVNQKTGNIVGGHQRYNVLRDMGITSTLAVVVDLDEDKEKLLNVALNKIEGDWDYEKLKEMLQEISPEDIFATGFSKEELDSFFSDDGGPVFGDAYEPDAAKKESGADDSDSDGTRYEQFTAYLSFPTKEAAEEWMKSEGISRYFPQGNRNIVIHMEGVNYGDS